MFDSGKKKTLLLIGCTVGYVPFGEVKGRCTCLSISGYMRNCGRLLISQGSCYPTDLCKVFGDGVMCITIKILCLVKLHIVYF